MKAESTIEKKEREYKREIQRIGRDPWEKVRHEHLIDYWRALRWVLGKDDDEMCLAQVEKR